MQSEKSQQITARFFQVLDELVNLGHIHFINDFYIEHNINTRNIYQLRKDYSKDILQLEWLTIIIDKYHASADYLFTGKGKLFKKELKKIERPLRRKYNKTKKESTHNGKETHTILHT